MARKARYEQVCSFRDTIDLPNVISNLNMRHSSTKNGLGGWIYLAHEGCFEAGLLKTNLEPPNAGEQAYRFEPSFSHDRAWEL
ncbi:hypothetical protein RBB73_12855 [Tunturiibacter empetritectus]|uniref:Uncharacterized protein n=1 Tax=Tunturiibacter empetritectus TaxID=3069691 RepID=A0A7W8MSZ5_9BACT|nr:hypothetical protein [Edaphobacter lichenicola]MBB5319496.1 hypothetical protein [Edaphobacter lichenicola]